MSIKFETTGINWEEQDVIQRSSSSSIMRSTLGKKFDPCAKKMTMEEFKEGLSEHFIVANQGYCIIGTEIEVVGDEYISVKQFKDVDGDLHKTTDFEKLPIGTKIFKDMGRRLMGFNTRYHEGERVEIEYPIIRQQVRVYKDRRIGCVYEIEWKGGLKDYFVFNPKYLATCANNQVGHNMLNDLEPTLTAKSLEILGKEYEEDDGKSYCPIIMIHDDKEVYDYSIIGSSRKSMELYINLIGDIFGVKEARASNEGYSYGNGSCLFSEELKNKVNEFLGIFKPENKILKDLFDDKWPRIYWGSSRKSEDGVVSLTYLDKLLQLKISSAKAKETQREYAEEIWPTINWYPGEDGITWERRGDVVICSIKNKEGWRTKAAFIYDVKNKTRKVLIDEKCYGDDKRTIKTLIPSLSGCILQNFVATIPGKWDSSKGEYGPSKQRSMMIVGEKKTYREIFDGTNVAWIMDNMSELGDDFEIASPESGYYSGGDCKLLKDEISEKRMGVMAICVLATTGDALLEQLLKNKQFNTYFAVIESIGNQRDKFKDIDKKHSRYGKTCYGIEYHGKQKSLKKMFGMTMPQIQELNKAITLVKESSRASYKIPCLKDCLTVLGVSSYADIDVASFAKLLTACKVGDDYSRNRMWSDIARKSRLLKLMEPMTVKARIDFILKYGGDRMPEVYDDYLQMRDQMLELQKRMPEEKIFDEHDYPIKVGAAHKFIRYTPGMRDSSCKWYSRDINSEREFKSYISCRFEMGEGEREIRYVQDEDTGALVGAVIKMNQFGHMNFLHDEMSRWFELYKDPAEAAAFDAALDRVKPLEWEDKEGELCIVAPTGPSDVRNEGKVLSHCVASYVDPIIKGTENIMFIRRKDMKGEPFFTVDVSPRGEIRQIHCYRNGNTSPADIAKAYAETGREVYNTKADIMGFMKKWATAMKGKIDKSSLKSSYGALCALHS